MPAKKEILAATLRHSGAGPLLRGCGAWHGLVVLNYHRIGDAATTPFDRGVFSGTQEQFARQLGIISECCDVIGLKDLDRALLDRRGRYALLTFDDGYRDNYELAFPVLHEARLPAVFFLTTGFLDQGLVAWWDEIAWIVRNSPRRRLEATTHFEALDLPEGDREPAIQLLLHAYKRLETVEAARFLYELAETAGTGRCPKFAAEGLWMTWDMAREMRRKGMDFGAHTVHHPILSRLPIHDQWRQIEASTRRVAEELGEPVEAFSYPVGAPDSFDATTKSLLTRADCRWGFSFYGGYASAGPRDLFDLPRYPMDPSLTDQRLAALLTLPQLFAWP